MIATLKSRLIRQFTASDQKRLQMLLQELELGDRRPSQFLSEMKNLANEQVGDNLLQSLWLQRLQTTVQQILATRDAKLDELVQLADKVCEISDSSHSCSVSSREERLSRMEKCISELTLAVN